MRKKILDAMQSVVFLYTMVQGFVFTYILVWCSVDLPLNAWTLLLLYALGGLSMWGFYKWCRRTSDVQ